MIRDGLTQSVQEKREGGSNVGFEAGQEVHVLFREVVEDPPSQALPRFSDLEYDNAPVGFGSPFPDQLLGQKGLGQATGGALLQVELVAEMCDRHGTVLAKGLKGVTLTYRKVVTARPISVPELKDPNEFPQGFPKTGGIPEKGWTMGRFRGFGHGGKKLFSPASKVVVTHNSCILQLTSVCPAVKSSPKEMAGHFFLGEKVRKLFEPLPKPEWPFSAPLPTDNGRKRPFA